MKIEIDDEMLSILVVGSLKADAKVLRKQIKKMASRSTSLSEAEHQDYGQMHHDLDAIVSVLDYYGVTLK